MPRVKAMKTKRILLSILFPERCACCGRVIPPSAGCCPSCLEKLPVIEPPLCPFCGAGTEDCTCGRHRRHFDRCASPFYYEDPVKEGILLFKEYGSAESAAFFAERMAEVFLREWGSPYLDWDYSDPERAVVGVALHAFEWLFVRVAPIILAGALLGLFLTRRQA